MAADDFIGGHDGTGVVWEIDFESGVHVLIGVARGRVFYHRDLIAEFGGIANGGLHTGVRDQSHDDDFVNAVLLELQIQIRVGKAAGTPMLRGDDIARAEVRTRRGSRRPRYRIRTTSATMLLSESARCTSRSRSRQDDIADASHRKPGYRFFAPLQESAAYEEHTGSLRRRPLCDPRSCRPRK